MFITKTSNMKVNSASLYVNNEGVDKLSAKTFQDVRLSVLDLVPICEGSTAQQSFKHSVDLAQHGDKWRFQRSWLAEHLNVPGTASLAISIIICYIALATIIILVGSVVILLTTDAPFGFA